MTIEVEGKDGPFFALPEITIPSPELGFCPSEAGEGYGVRFVLFLEIRRKVGPKQLE